MVELGHVSREAGKETPGGASARPGVRSAEQVGDDLPQFVRRKSAGRAGISGDLPDIPETGDRTEPRNGRTALAKTMYCLH